MRPTCRVSDFAPEFATEHHSSATGGGLVLPIGPNTQFGRDYDARPSVGVSTGSGGIRDGIRAQTASPPCGVAAQSPAGLNPSGWPCSVSPPGPRPPPLAPPSLCA